MCKRCSMTKQQQQRPYKQIPIDRSQAKCLADVVLLYIRYAADRLTLQTRTLEYAEKIYRENIRGEIIRNPRMTAAGIIYISLVMCQDNRTQLDVAECLHVSEQALRQNYKELKKRLNIV